MADFAVEVAETVITVYYITAENEEKARNWEGEVYDMKDIHRSYGEIREIREVG